MRLAEDKARQSNCSASAFKSTSDEATYFAQDEHAVNANADTATT